MILNYEFFPAYKWYRTHFLRKLVIPNETAVGEEHMKTETESIRREHAKRKWDVYGRNQRS